MGHIPKVANPALALSRVKGSREEHFGCWRRTFLGWVIKSRAVDTGHGGTPPRSQQGWGFRSDNPSTFNPAPTAHSVPLSFLRATQLLAL